MLLTAGGVECEAGSAGHVDAVNPEQRLPVPAEPEVSAPLSPLELLVDLGPAQGFLDHGSLDVGQVQGQNRTPHQSEVPTSQDL